MTGRTTRSLDTGYNKFAVIYSAYHMSYNTLIGHPRQLQVMSHEAVAVI